MSSFPNKETQFSTENQPDKNGRKKKIYSVINEMGYSADDIKTAFGELAFYSLAELKAVHDDENKPIITRIIANQFFQALKKSDWNKIKEILEHVIGKPQYKLDVTSGNEKINTTILVQDKETKEELNKLINGND